MVCHCKRSLPVIRVASEVNPGSMTRASQAAIAVVVVAGVPVLVGQVAQPPEAPKATETSLTANLESSETDGNSAELRVVTDGAPPSEPAVLTDDGGRHPVTVRGQAASACSALEARRATSAESGTEWCLLLNGLDDGRNVSGAVASSGTTLALTVNRREPIWPWPLFAALGGLVVGALIFLIPRWLRGQVRTALLTELLDENDFAGEERKVEGLRDWVAARRDAGAKDNDLLPVLSGVVKRGPPAARRARHELAEAIRVTPVSASHRFVTAARAAAERRDHKLTDFLKPDGAVRDVHPAREWLAALAQLAQIEVELGARQREIESTLVVGDCRTKPEAALATATAAFSSADSAKEVDDLEAKLDEVEQAIEVARQEPGCTGGNERLFAAGGATIRVAGPAAPPAEMLDLGTSGLPRPVTPSIALLRRITIALGFVLTGWALLALYLGVYEPKPAFGTTADFIALITAAIGSGAAGAVLGLVAIWKPDEPVAD